MMLAVVMYFWVMTVIVLSIMRYMIPAMGFVAIFSGVTLEAAMTCKIRWRNQ